MKGSKPITRKAVTYRIPKALIDQVEKSAAKRHPVIRDVDQYVEFALTLAVSVDEPRRA